MHEVMDHQVFHALRSSYVPSTTEIRSTTSSLNNSNSNANKDDDYNSKTDINIQYMHYYKSKTPLSII